MAAIEFMKRGFSMGHGALVATVPHVADCHHAGQGPLYTGHPIVVDLFPRDETTRYWGDCTRTVVHGEASVTVKAMYSAVVEAKAAATEVGGKKPKAPIASQKKTTGQSVGAKIIAAGDKNGDGFLTEDEFQEKDRANFPKVDANGDGKVDAAELDLAIKAASGG